MIELQLSKRQIPELYLNRIYLGRNIYGDEAMAQNLFGKSAADLTLAESAFIAGLVRTPSGLSHLSNACLPMDLVLGRINTNQ